MSKAVAPPATGPVRRKLRLLIGVATAALMMSAAACGGGAATAAPSGGTKATKASPDPRAAFLDCLRKNGVTLPSGRPGGIPTGRPTGRPSGAPGGGFFRRPGDGRTPSLSPELQQAMQACNSLRPTNGPGRGFDQSAFQAFRACMQDHGVPLPDGQGGARRFATTDPKVAKALKTCRPLMPTGAPSPAAAPSPATS